MSAPGFGLTPGLSFGATPQTTQQSGFTFGSTPTGTAGPTFGSTPGASAPTFGAPPAAAPAFGSTLAAPAFGSTPAASAPTFGSTPTASVPAFGTTPTAAPAFGATPAASAPTFGSLSGASVPTFATPATSAPAFGSTPTATPTPTFGSAPAATSAPTFGFGAPSTTTAPTTQSGFSFGAPAASTTQSGFTFGSPAAPTTTTQSSLTFNMPTTSAGTPNFSTSTTAPQTPGFFSSTTSAPSLFSTTKPAFGLAPTSTPSLFGAKPATTTPSSGGNLGGEVSPPSLIKAVKDNSVPPEMMQLIDGFKNTIKQQKNYSSEVARSSVKPLQKTSEDIESVKHLLAKLERAVNLNKSINNKLKADTMRCVTDCEMAQRTMEISPGFQSDNMAPLDYFTLLAERFQEQVILLRIEIENTEKHIHSALDPTALSPHELNDSMKRLHECFVALAGRLQLVHSSMSTLKQSHLEIRRKKTSDFTDIFDRKQAALKQKPDLSTPGAPLTANSLYSSVAALVQSRIAPEQQNTSFGQTTGLQGFGFLQQPNAASTPATTGNVQLKSPPGSKRGKR